MEVLGYSQAKEKGFPRYFTGKPCKYGHIAERRVADRGCVACSSEKMAKHREQNPNSSREVAKRYREKHPERLKASKKRHYAKNADAISEYNKKRYAENAEARRAAAREYRKANPDKAKQAAKRHYEKNRDALITKRREYYRANIEAERKAARIRSRETYSDRRDNMVEYLREYYAENKEAHSQRSKRWREANQEKCKQYHVNRKSRLKGADGHHTADDIERIRQDQADQCNACACDLSETGFHVDHIVALSKGGSNWPENLQLLCPTCNLSKGDKDFTEWLQSRMAA